MSLKIGLFDSGIGGLTVLTQLVKYMPDAEYFYVADTLNAPFGTRTQDQILVISLRVLDFLKRSGVDCIVTACNTADASIRSAKVQTQIPYFGILDFEISADLQKVAVIATKFTVQNGIYGRILKSKGAKEVLEIPCQSLVKIVEEGLIDSSQADQEIENCMGILRNSGTSTLVFGCTHFPFLAHKIRAHFPELILFDPAQSVAEKVWRTLMKTNRGNGKVNFFVTSDPSSFSNKILKYQRLFDLPFTVELIDLGDPIR
ncbi:MAG: glutamate racemase [Pseudothermotoga sp.]